jgi:hypothetical protein
MAAKLMKVSVGGVNYGLVCMPGTIQINGLPFKSLNARSSRFDFPG